MIEFVNTLTQSVHSEQFEITMLLASFFGGLIASISPCSLAMLPIIVGYIGGYSKEKPLKTFAQMLAFILGTAVVFTIIGVICAVTGKVFISFFGSYFGLIIASFLIVMGLKLMDVLNFEFPVFIKAFPKNTGKFAFLYPFIIGMVFMLRRPPRSTPIMRPASKPSPRLWMSGQSDRWSWKSWWQPKANPGIIRSQLCLRNHT